MGRLFGTDGVRGIANQDLTCELAMGIGRAAAMVLAKDGRRRPVFVIGADTRASSDMLCAALTAGLCSVGADVIQLGVVPTPAVAFLVGKYKADAGIMISASHNPFYDNGIKLINSFGEKMDEQVTDLVEAYLEDMYQIFTLIKEATGVTPTVFRFPGGSINGYNYEVEQDIISEMLRRGFVPYDWNVSSGDASGDLAAADTIVANVVRGASGTDRGIVLMHDASPKTTTVAALRPMISQLRSMGFQFDCLHPETKPILFGYSY